MRQIVALENEPMVIGIPLDAERHILAHCGRSQFLETEILAACSVALLDKALHAQDTNRVSGIASNQERRKHIAEEKP